MLYGNNIVQKDNAWGILLHLMVLYYDMHIASHPDNGSAIYTLNTIICCFIALQIIITVNDETQLHKSSVNPFYRFFYSNQSRFLRRKMNTSLSSKTTSSWATKLHFCRERSQSLTPPGLNSNAKRKTSSKNLCWPTAKLLTLK